MPEQKDAIDRRAYPRFKVKEGAFAALSPDSYIMGQIDNISKGGLSFKYIVHKEQYDEIEASYVFVGVNGFYLEKIPYRRVEDIQIESSSSLSSINMRRMRLQFIDLTPNQSAQLEYFLSNRTDGIEK